MKFITAQQWKSLMKIKTILALFMLTSVLGFVGGAIEKAIGTDYFSVYGTIILVFLIVMSTIVTICQRLVPKKERMAFRIMWSDSIGYLFIWGAVLTKDTNVSLSFWLTGALLIISAIERFWEFMD